jgi:hypothetical protein
LSFLLLGCTQLFGLLRGYECHCSGKAVLTLADHCHKPHGTAHLEAPAPLGDPSHSAADCQFSDEDNDYHAALRADSESLLPVSLAAPTATWALLAALPALETRMAPPAVLAGTRRIELTACRPPPSIEAARTVVLLI